MKKRFSGACFLLIALSCVAGSVYGHNPLGPTLLSGAGFAIVDGVMTPGEWNGAATTSFDVNLPDAEGGGTARARLYVMNDSRNFYIGVRIRRATIGRGVSIGVEFENDHDGLREPGDDVLVSTTDASSSTLFADDFRTTCAEDPVGSTGCAPEDIDWSGTSDGSTAVTNNGVFTFVEIAHPLDSRDNSHDFSLRGGDTVGFTLFVRISTLAVCTETDPFLCFGDTGFPTETLDAGMFGDITVQTVGRRDCHRICNSTRRAVVAKCLAAGGSRRVCNRAGRDYLRACHRGCR